MSRLFRRRGDTIATVVYFAAINVAFCSLALGAGSDYAADASVSRSPPPRETALREMTPRKEADRDRLHAEALFCAGRLREIRGDWPGAVRRYRRALRYDPASLPAARHLVQLLTYHLKSPQEAARHAVRTVESYSDDPVLLERLGLFLLDEGELVRAAVLFEKAIESRDDESDSRPETRVAAGLLRLELARIQLLLEREDRARFHLEKAVGMLGKPGETGLASPSGSRIEGSRIERAAAEAWRLLAGVLLSAGRLDEAEAAFEEAQRRRPGKGGSALARARLLEKRGLPAEALAQLESYLKSPSVDDGVEPYALLARLLAKDGEKAGEETALLRRLRRLYAVHSDNAALGGFFAEQLLQKDRPQEAEAVASRLVRNTPTPEAIRLLLDLYRRGKRYRDTLRLLGSIAGAAGSFDALDLDKTPIDDDPEWVDGIIAAARTALTETPDEFGFGERLAAALVAANAGRFEDAGPFYRAAVNRDPKSAGEIALTWASRLLAAERPQDAVRVLRAEGLRRKTGLQAVLVDELLAAALELSGETDEAIELLRASIGRRPDSPRLRARLGWVLVHADRTAEAEDVYRALVAKYDDDYRRAEIREILRDAKLALSACALERDAPSDAPEESEEWLEQVLDEFPDDPDALNDLAYLWADRGAHPARAERMARRAVEAEPEESAFRDTLGWALFRLEHYKEARRELEKAIELGGDDPAIFEHLAKTLDCLGEKKAAEETRKRAAEASE